MAVTVNIRPNSNWFSDNMIPAASSDFTTDGTAAWYKGVCTLEWKSAGYVTLHNTTGDSSFLAYVGLFPNPNKTYSWSIRLKSDTFNQRVGFYANNSGYTLTGYVTSTWTTHTGTMVTGAVSDTHLYIQLYGGMISDLDIDDIIIKEVLA